MKYSLCLLLALVACGSPTPTPSPSPSQPVIASAPKKAAALKASRAVKAIQRLSALDTPNPGRDFTVNDPETLTIPETACSEEEGSGTVKGEIVATKESDGTTAANAATARYRLTLTFDACVTEGTTLDGGPFTQGIGVTAVNNGTQEVPDITMTFEMYMDGKLEATGALPGKYDFSDFSMKIGPIPVELTGVGDEEEGAARQTAATEKLTATLNGSFVDGGETFTFNNEIIELSTDELEDVLPADYDNEEDPV